MLSLFEIGFNGFGEEGKMFIIIMMMIKMKMIDNG